MKLCCIDVGTNSVLSLTARIDSNGRITPLQFHAETTRLGKSAGVITKKAKARTISAIKKHLTGADKYIIAGTSALRESRNRNYFIKSLRKESGQSIRILPEDEEAGLVFDSVKYFLKPLPKKTIICDIGGGSTELIYCLNGRAVKKISIPVGAVNTRCAELNLAHRLPFFKAPLLIGVGGTVTTLGAILKRLKYYTPDKIHGYIVPFYKVADTLKKLQSLPLDARKKLISFDPKRADIIVPGLCILKEIMERFGIDRLKICDRGLVYGLAVNYAKCSIRGT